MNDIMGFIYFMNSKTVVFWGRIAFCLVRPFAEVVSNPRAAVNSGFEPAGSFLVRFVKITAAQKTLCFLQFQ